MHMQKGGNGYNSFISRVGETFGTFSIQAADKWAMSYATAFQIDIYDIIGKKNQRFRFHRLVNIGVTC